MIRPGEAEVMTRAVASMVITWSVADPPALTRLTCEGGGTAGRDMKLIMRFDYLHLVLLSNKHKVGNGRNKGIRLQEINLSNGPKLMPVHV